MHLGIVSTHPRGSATFKVLWPFMDRYGGFEDVIVFTPAGVGSWHPPGVRCIGCGPEGHVETGRLPQRMVRWVEQGLLDPMVSRITLVEYDTFFARAFVRRVPEGAMCGGLVGGNVEGCDNSWFMHWPITATRATWEAWLKSAKRMLAEGDDQKGFPDIFSAVACDQAGIRPLFTLWGSYSQNTIHTSRHLGEARRAYLAGASRGA